MNYSDAAYQNFAQFVSDFEVNNDIKVEPPAPTLQTPLVKEVCKNFGLTDVDLDYSDAEYQKLTTYKMFKKAYRSRIQSVNPKVRNFVYLLIIFIFSSIFGAAFKYKSI